MSDLDEKIKKLFQQLDESDKLAFLTAFESALKEQSSPAFMIKIIDFWGKKSYTFPYSKRSMKWP